MSGPTSGSRSPSPTATTGSRRTSSSASGTIHQIRDFAGGPIVGNNASSPSGTGSVLDDKDAYNLFNGWCSKSFARGFKLYNLYQRAAAFTGQPAQ